MDLIKKQQIDASSIDKRYASEAAMIADQANQIDKYLYFDGTSYWEYLGTTLGTIADYRLLSFTISGLNLEMLETQSNTVKFDRYGGYMHGNAGEISGVITFDFTNGLLGVVSKMKYVGYSAPTLPVQAKVIAGYFAIDYSINYVTFELVKKDIGSEEVWVTVSQEV